MKYSAVCYTCSEFWNSVREKHNRVLLATRIFFFTLCTERGRAFFSRSYTYPWRRLSNWCNCNFSNNGKKCRRKSVGSANKPNGNMLTCRLKSDQTEAQEQLFREQAERQQVDMKAMLQCLANPSSSGRVVPPTTTSVTATPTFSPFDSTSELWKDYSHLYQSSCCSTWLKGSGFPHQPVVDGVLSYFQTLLHKKRRREKSTVLRWIRSWRTWRCNLIQPVSSSGNVSSSGLPCNVGPRSSFKSWLHA